VAAPTSNTDCPPLLHRQHNHQIVRADPSARNQSNPGSSIAVIKEAVFSRSQNAAPRTLDPLVVSLMIRPLSDLLGPQVSHRKRFTT